MTCGDITFIAEKLKEALGDAETVVTIEPDYSSLVQAVESAWDMIQQNVNTEVDHDTIYNIASDQIDNIDIEYQFGDQIRDIVDVQLSDTVQETVKGLLGDLANGVPQDQHDLTLNTNCHLANRLRMADRVIQGVTSKIREFLELPRSSGFAPSEDKDILTNAIAACDLSRFSSTDEDLSSDSKAAWLLRLTAALNPSAETVSDDSDAS